MSKYIEVTVSLSRWTFYTLALESCLAEQYWICFLLFIVPVSNSNIAQTTMEILAASLQQLQVERTYVANT